MKPGIYPGLSFEEYKSIPAINKSGLDEIASSPLHYWANYLDPEREPRGSTASMVLGTAIHTRTLEPEKFWDRYVLEPVDAPKRPSSSQLNAKKPSPETIEAIEFWARFNREAEGKEILSRDHFETCEKVAQAVRKSAAATELLREGTSEVTVIWETKVMLADGSEVQVPCKARIDFLSALAILDVKSTQSAGPGPFARSVVNYRYHMQAAFYSDGLRAAIGEDRPFIFLAFETSAPYACAFYLADEVMIDVGRKLYLPLIQKYAEAVHRNEWPGYPDEIKTLSLPAWAIKEASNGPVNEF